MSGGESWCFWCRAHAVFAHHPDPSWCVAAHHESLIVGFRVTIEFSVSEHVVDGAQHFVGGCHSGSLVSATDFQACVVALELTVLGAGGGVGAFDQDAAQVGIALAGAPGATLSGALVVSGTQPGPRGAVIVAGKDAHVRTEFDEDGGCGGAVHAGHGGEQIELCGMVGERFLDEPIVALQTLGDGMPGGEMILEHEAGA